MVQCPECGTPAEESATVCAECGATLDDDRHEEQEGQRSGSQQGYGHQQSRNAGGQGERSNEGDDSDGVDRRTVLAGVGGVAVLGGGGFLGYQEFVAGGSSASSGPKSTAREFITAIGEQDAETARSLAHPESTQNFSFDDSTTGSITINELREVDPDTDRASTAVEADLWVTEAGDTKTATYRVELLQYEGEWTVWRAGTDSRIERFANRTDPTRAPTASFSFDFELTDEANSAGFLTITHDGGESIGFDKITVRGNGFTTPAKTGAYDTSSETTIVGDSPIYWPLSAANDDRMIQAGNSISVGVTTAYDLWIVWAYSDLPRYAHTATRLAEAEGPDA